MKTLALVVAVMVVSGAGPARADAQDLASSKFRLQVRGGERLQGYIRDRSAHEIVLVTADGREHRVPVLQVDRLEVRSRDGSHFWRGALIGAFVGASLVATGAIDAIEDRGKTSGAALGLVGGATVAGAVIGRTVPRYGWNLTDPRAVADRGVGISLAFRF